MILSFRGRNLLGLFIFLGYVVRYCISCAYIGCIVNNKIDKKFSFCGVYGDR